MQRAPALPSFAACVLSLTMLSEGAHAQAPCAPGQPQLVIVHAGSLTAAFRAVEAAYTRQTGICVVDVAAGSVAAARQVASGQQPCDIFASADDAVITQMLQPAGLANYSIRFAAGSMVLAYTTASRGAAGITAAESPFKPPADVPTASADWTSLLTQTGVVVAGSHPFLDPGAYRADLIFQLAEDRYARPGLYNDLLGHYSVSRPGDALGKTFDYQFTYEHSALAAFRADTTGTYRYAKLPDGLGLSDPAASPRYVRRSITIPGLQTSGAGATVTIAAGRVHWGLTVMNAAPHRDNALSFLRLLFSPQGVALQSAAGPQPISPPTVSRKDYARLPDALQPLVQSVPDSTP